MATTGLIVPQLVKPTVLAQNTFKWPRERIWDQHALQTSPPLCWIRLCPCCSWPGLGVSLALSIGFCYQAVSPFLSGFTEQRLTLFIATVLSIYQLEVSENKPFMAWLIITIIYNHLSLVLRALNHMKSIFSWFIGHPASIAVALATLGHVSSGLASPSAHGGLNNDDIYHLTKINYIYIYTTLVNQYHIHDQIWSYSKCVYRYIYIYKLW